ncbi:MAG: hypothetical protein ACJ788_14905 [Ktedonobacteraceae bacterium]
MRFVVAELASAIFSLTPAISPTSTKPPPPTMPPTRNNMNHTPFSALLMLRYDAKKAPT